MSPTRKKSKTTINVPSESSYIRVVSDKILDSLKGRNVDELEIFNIKLCSEEALRNAMEHGNKFRKELPVKVSYGIVGSRLEIEIEDSGKGFKREDVVDPTTDENILQERGRGVYLIHRLMDEVKYNEKGNKIMMAKNLERGGAQCK